MIELIETGDVAAARKIHESLSPLFNALFITSNPIPVKAALEMLGRKVGAPRLPLRARHRGGAGAGAQGAGGCRSPLTPPPRRSSSSGASARWVATWPASSWTDRLLIVDVGLSFPSADLPGIDLVLPDFDYVRGRADEIQAIVLTHGHEDHIGAVSYLLRELDDVIPVYGTPFTWRCCEASWRSTGSPIDAS